VRVFKLFPAYQVGDGLINLSTLYYRSYFLGQDGEPFDYSCVGSALQYMTGQSVVFTALVLGLDSDMFDQARQEAIKFLEGLVTRRESAPAEASSQSLEVDESEKTLPTPWS
jgi:hypothetical protein